MWKKIKTRGIIRKNLKAIECDRMLHCIVEETLRSGDISALTNHFKLQVRKIDREYYENAIVEMNELKGAIAREYFAEWELSFWAKHFLTVQKEIKGAKGGSQ